MRKIIKPGKTEFISVCSRCGCKFSYELEDIGADNYVRCPECNERLLHNAMPDYGYQTVPYTVPCVLSTDMTTVSSDSTNDDEVTV